MVPPEDASPGAAGQPARLAIAGAASEALREWKIPSRTDDLDNLAAVPQLDDAGANTADLYEWQAAMATADGLSLYRAAINQNGVLDPGCDDYVLCEWHEDWVVGVGDRMELVSGKHRSPDVGAYTTLNALADKGGLAHLFNRWFELGQKPLCRLVTTGGLTAGDAQHLRDLTARLRGFAINAEDLVLSDKESEIVRKMCAAIAKYDDITAKRWTPDKTDPAVSTPGVATNVQMGEVAAFLGALTITTVEVNRGVVRDVAPLKYVKPILQVMGRDVRDCAAVWAAALGLFRERMQSQGETTWGDLPQVMQRDRSGGQEPDMRRRIARRLVTLGDIHVAIQTALAIPAAYRPVPQAPPVSRVEIKMTRGGCSPNAVGRATALRLDYEDHWRNQESGDPEARAARRSLERLLRRVSDHAMGDSELSGHKFWTALDTKLVELQEAGNLPAGVDSDIALGGISDLSNRCQVWFGPHFDIEAVLAERRSQGAIES